MFKGLMLFSLCVFSLSAVAAAPDLPLQANTPFQAQQAKVRSDLSAGEIYSEITVEDRAKVVAALDRMSGMIGDGDAEQLSPDAKVAFFNEQEIVNTILTKVRRDSRLICRREKSVGSNRPTTTCLTFAQRERMREDGVESLRSLRPSKSNSDAN